MRWLVGILVVLLPVGSLRAQGFSIHSHSACSVGRNSTGVAEPCTDGSAVFYNPAALASQRGVASAGVSALYSTSTFTFDGTGASFESEQGTKLAPYAWLAAPMTDRIGAGVGLWAPYGLSTEWPVDERRRLARLGDEFEGRFDGFHNTLRAIYVQPTLAGEVIPDRLTLGAGVAAVRTTVQVRRRLDLSRTPIPGTSVRFSAIGVPDGTDFAAARIQADDWTATFHVGLQFLPSDRWALGVRYLHTAHFDLTGTAKFTQLETGFRLPAGNPLGLPAGTPIDAVLAPLFQSTGPLADPQGLTTELTLPNQVVAGVRWQADSDTRLFLEYQWTGWSHLDGAALHFANAPADTVFFDYDDASTFRLAAEYAPSDAVAVRCGILHNTAAAPDVSVNPLLPEAARTSFAAGVGYRFAERFGADFGLELLLQEERRGSVRPHNSRSQTASELNVGRYSAHGVFGSFTFSWFLGSER